MSRRYKVKFEEDGERCLNTISYLRKHPECGIRFIDDKPFSPINPKPSPIPPSPIPPKPQPPNVPIIPIDPTVLSQDTTNNFQTGRQLVGDYYYNNQYETMPKNDNDAYSHEDIERERPVGEIEMEDFGAGVGIPNDRPRPIEQPRIRPRPDPRGVNVDELIERTEISLQRGEELLRPRGVTNQEIELQRIQQLTRNVDVKEADLIEAEVKSKGKKRAKIKPTEQEMFPLSPDSEELVFLKEVDKRLTPGEIELTINQKNSLVQELLSRGLSREKINELLDRYEAYDPGIEEATGGKPKTEEEKLIRLLKRGIRGIPTRDTNLLPERLEEIELRDDTPLVRGRTDIASGRTRLEKIIDKTAARLPEDYREIISRSKANLQKFNENVRNEMLEAKQTLVNKTEMIFGRKYELVPQIELTDNRIAVRPPKIEPVVTEPLNVNPLGEDYGTFGIKPKLSFAERLKAVRTGGFDTTLTAGGAVGGVLLGGLASAGLNKLLGNPDNIGIQSAIGGVGGATGDVGARILTMAGTKALTRTAVETGAETASAAFIRGSTSLLRGAGEGALVGAVLTPIDILLNNALVNRGMSHLGANLTSGTLVGGAGVATTAIGLAALGAAPETLGASVIIGGVAIAVTDVIGAITGSKQDAERQQKLNDAKREAAQDLQYYQGRTELLKSLPNNNYNIYEAIENYPNVDELGMMSASWDTFLNQSQSIFVPRPKIIEPSNTEKPTDKKLNDYFNKFITHSLIKNSCENGNCGDLKKQDPGSLTDDEYKYLNDKTFQTWLPRATQQVVMIQQELKYKQIRIKNAKQEILNAYHKDGKVADQLDPYVVQTAYLDPSFKHEYELAIKLDAQQQVIDAYKKDQTKIDQLPKNIRQLAKQDPEFDTKIHQYYSVMEENAEKLNLSVPELVYLQKFNPEEQKDKYQELQFTDLQIDPKKVSEAQKLNTQQIKAKDAGYYDIDQALLETDPTDITSWKPSDSQILQAHAAGMTLQEYTDYMYELSLGYSGDYERLPKYSKDQIRASGILDYSHFQDELQTAGYDKDLYLYNADTGTFTLNPNVRTNVIPNTQNQFIPRYIPSKLAKARQEYADMIHGVNENIQSQIDNYNANLSKELSSYGRHYAEIVSSVNDERLYAGRSDLLHFDAQKLYDQNKIEFKQEPTQQEPTQQQPTQQQPTQEQEQPSS